MRATNGRELLGAKTRTSHPPHELHNHVSKFARAASVFAIAAFAALCMNGCIIGGNGPLERIGETQTENISVPASGAKQVHAHLQMAAGEIDISGGSAKLCDGSITYNVPEWKPDLSYSVNDAQGSLMIMQPESHHTTFGGTKYAWDLHFNNKIPLELAVEMGAGDSKLNLADLQLRDLNVKVGAGDATIDLTGNWNQDVTATLQGGVGDLRLKLPRGMSVRVTVQGGIGSVEAPDFKRNGSEYVNDAYAQGKPTINVSISGGIGDVHLELAGSSRGIV
jgi:hypothetical protein